MKPWILYACLTVVAWGVWGVFSKLASNYGRLRQTLLFQVAGVMAFGLIVLASERFHIEWSPQGFGWSAAAGFINFVGFLTFLCCGRKRKSLDRDRYVLTLPRSHDRVEHPLSA